MISLFPQDLYLLRLPLVSWFTCMLWPLSWALEFLPSPSQHYTGKFSGRGDSVASSLIQCHLSMLRDHVRCLHSIRAGTSLMLYFAFWWEGPWICTSMFSLHCADTFDRAAWSAKSHADANPATAGLPVSRFLTTTTGRAVKCQPAILERCLHLWARRAKISPHTGDVCPPAARGLSRERKGTCVSM